MQVKLEILTIVFFQRTVKIERKTIIADDYAEEVGKLYIKADIKH